jgi:hypothetical protein
MSVTRRIAAGAVVVGLTGAGLVLSQSARAADPAGPPAPVGTIGIVPEGTAPGTSVATTGHEVTLRLTGTFAVGGRTCPVDASERATAVGARVYVYASPFLSPGWAQCAGYGPAVSATVDGTVQPDGTAVLEVTPAILTNVGFPRGETGTAVTIVARPGSTHRQPWRFSSWGAHADVVAEVTYR